MSYSLGIDSNNISSEAQNPHTHKQINSNDIKPTRDNETYFFQNNTQMILHPQN